ncbi:MAG: biopolymer transporter ExbD [Spongiibacteraceae bacterium]|nr:biopolymer transporter ExbD [Spongiibacteraceae bacterium]
MKSSLRARRMARNHRRMQGSPKLNLVSLMDIFTILVFFLMVNSGDVEVLQSDKSIKLPDSVSKQRPDLTVLVKLNATDVIVQGRSVASVDDILKLEEDIIAGLNKELNYLASKKPLLTDLEKKKGRAVTIMGDQHIPYKLLKRVMTTCAQADYRDISLAVNTKPVTDDAALMASPEVGGS